MYFSYYNYNIMKGMIILPMMFTMMTALVMVIISVLGFFLASEYFAKDVRKSARKKLIFINIIIIIGFVVLYPKLLDFSYAAILGEIVVMWYVLQVFLIILGILVKIFRLIYEKSRHQEIDESKRRFLRGVIWVPAISATLYGGLYESRHIEFVEQDINCKDFPKLNGMKIAHLTDVHLGNFFSVKQFYEVLNQIAHKSPDMLVITGDVFDNGKINDEAIKILNAFTPYFPFGVYFCWGNHEHMRGIEHLKEALSKTNIKVLNNESIKILSGDKPLYLLGVDYVDEQGGQDAANMRKQYLQKALTDVPESAYKILLAHHSIFIDEAFKHNINLTLTGHTHGGQFAFLGIPIIPMFKYMRGRFEQNNSIGYVSSGAGSWFPYRIGCSPEVTFFNFKA